MTPRDLITSTLRLLGALAPGESLDATEATDGLSALNLMIDSLSNENLLINAVTEEAAITLTPGTAEYTLGSGGSITTRPQTIQEALIRDESGSDPVDYPLNVLSLSEWASISTKDLQSSLPTDLYDDGGYPQRTIKLYPVPSAAYSLVLFTARPLTQISTLDTSISLPPGYERMLKYNLAIDLAPEYGRQISQEVAMIAMDSKAVLKRTNHKPSYLRCDEALVSRAGFNILTGDYR